MTITKMDNLHSSIAGSSGVLQAAKEAKEIGEFSSLVNSINSKDKDDTKLTGDVQSNFHGSFLNDKDKVALPQGAARAVTGRTIDKTSTLYEKSMELESYFVKQMLSSMRSTLGKSSLGEKDSMAKKMYEDMLYDEYAVKMTKDGGFGLADQIYLSLV